MLAPASQCPGRRAVADDVLEQLLAVPDLKVGGLLAVGKERCSVLPSQRADEEIDVAIAQTIDEIVKVVSRVC